MKKTKIIIGVLAVVCGILAVIYEMKSESTLVFHPKGIIAQAELNHMVLNILIMLGIIVPTFIWLMVTAWKYRSNNAKAEYKPEADKPRGVCKNLLLWIVPSIFVAALATHTWFCTHELDPARPLVSTKPPLVIQVVAIDWKWLFIYPEQGIATLNFFQIPDNTPIQLQLSADESPMNSFWLPELSGQIYAMTGMITPLHIMADAPGVYRGRASEINGDGYASMTFIAKSTTQKDFDEWVAAAQQSPIHLTKELYTAKILKRSKRDPIEVYSHVEKDLFNDIVMKYMYMPTPSQKEL